ncbi:amino acid adenylation domain-containing protein [Micromonospora sp. NPDC007271]|uniref:amino acid adenylation domain-containing protein n=1 Tax=Micromonospora sp. NPDC007271 TaxID=3154587 RepID=UPI0033F3DB11
MSPDQRADLSAAKAALLRRWRSGAAAAGLPPVDSAIPPAGPGPAPLSAAQRRLWFAEQLMPGTAANNLAHCLALNGRLDAEVLRAALADLVARHDILRTVVHTVDGEPVQVLRDGAAPTLELVDHRDREGGDDLAAAVAYARTVADTPMDVAAGPLARLVLCRTSRRDVLVLVVHHLIADGWALAVALRELSTCYTARLAGVPAALPALPVRYADVATWEQSRDHGEDLAYWRQRLAGLRPLALPTDRPHAAEPTGAGDWCELGLTAADDEAIRRFARAENVTVYMVLQAAFTAVLHAITGDPDIAVGGAVAGRQRPEVHDLIGNFTNTVALRTPAPSGSTFRGLLGAVRETVLGALAHQRAPFDRVVEELHLSRSAAHSGPLNVLFVLQPPVPAVTFGGTTAEAVPLGWRTARADLELHLSEAPALHGGLVFRTDLFDSGTARHIAERITSTLRAVLTAPDAPLVEVAAAGPRERALLARWSAGPHRTTPEETLPGLVLRSAARRPEAPAVTAEGTVLTYAALAARSARIAARLRALGVGPEEPVIAALPRCTDLVVTALAVMRAGACYTPVDPAHGPDRLAEVLQRSGARVLICGDDLADRLAADNVTVAHLLRAGGDPASGDPASGTAGLENRLPAVDPDSAAYLVFTSGSTGEPKGVVISHRSAVNHAFSLVDEHGFDEHTVLGAIASPAFDASIVELFGPLAAGGTVHLIAAEDTADGSALAAALHRGGVTALSATATVWHLLRRSPQQVRVRAMVGGEPVSEVLAHYLATTQEAAFTQYGPTEASIWSLVARLRPGQPVPLGDPIRNTTCHLLDEDLRPVPAGAVGEICLGGAAVGRGYLGQPALTADRFVPDPFSAQPGGRLYRTGDYARRRGDGTLQFAGRRDGQVKVRGHRVELGAVESAAERHPAIAECAAAVHQDPADPDSQLLVGYLVRRGRPGDPDSDLVPTVRRHLRQLLPSYLVPDRLVVLPELPRTGTGKVDRVALPRPAGNVRRAEHPYVAPRTQLEREIAECVGELLQLDRVGVTDDFFELGGHSIRAAQLVVRLQERYDVEIVLQKLFDTPTVEHLAKLIEAGIDRRAQLADRQVALRRIVDALPGDQVDQLLSQLIAERAHDPQAPAH